MNQISIGHSSVMNFMDDARSQFLNGDSKKLVCYIIDELSNYHWDINENDETISFASEAELMHFMLRWS